MPLTPELLSRGEFQRPGPAEGGHRVKLGPGAGLTVVSRLVVPAEMNMSQPGGRNVLFVFVLAWMLAAIPLAFVLPRLRAAFLGRLRRVPSDAHPLPRWLVRLLLGAAIGQSVGVSMLGVVEDHRLFWFAGSLAMIAAAFCAGAWPRLAKHPRTEFATRWWYHVNLTGSEALLVSLATTDDARCVPIDQCV